MTSVHPSCFVCGSKNTGAHSLFIRQPEQHGPYFPFLETHEPPDGSELPTMSGQVLACFMCYSFLVQQWESYEKNKMPLIKRIYWMKRVDNGPYTGVEMGMQSEYASQMFGLTSDCPGSSEIKKPNPTPLKIENDQSRPTSSHSASQLSPENCFATNIPSVSSNHFSNRKHEMQQEALDLSIEGPLRKRKLYSYHCKRDPQTVDMKSSFETSKPSGEVLDLSMPEKGTEMCHLCRLFCKKDTLKDIMKLDIDTNNPFFAKYIKYGPHNEAYSKDPCQQYLCCKVCSAFLFSQWKHFEKLKVPYNQRYYSLKNNSTNNDNVCYKCHKVQPQSSLQLVSCPSNQEGTTPITTNGEVRVCDECKKTPIHPKSIALQPTDNSISDFVKREPCSMGSLSLIRAIDASLSSHKIQNAVNNDSEFGLDSVSCCLCHQNYSLKQMQTLPMAPDPVNSSSMFFPFLKYLPQVNRNMITKDDRILACKACHAHLTCQWQEYEKDNIPPEQRHFFLRTLPMTSRSPSLSPFSSHTPPRVSSVPSVGSEESASPGLSQSENTQDGSFEEARKSRDQTFPEKYSAQSQEETEPPIPSTEATSLTLSAITTQKPLNINVNCYICGFLSKAGQTFSVKSKYSGKEMFFPFLSRHISAHPEAATKDSSYLLCLICFHSLVVQWQHYEKGRIEYHARFYDTYNFSCYVCGTKTYRQRLFLIPVKDYPFLKEHVCPPGGMVVNKGNSVVVCKDCYTSLNEQYLALDRLGVPVEKRQYNWIQRPPPPPDFEESSVSSNKSRPNCVTPKSPFGPSSTQPSIAFQRVVSSRGGSEGCSRDLSSSSLHESKEEGLSQR